MFGGIEAYREELRRVYGDEIVRRSLVFRNQSWYYLSVAVRTKEGIKTDMFPKPIRRSEFEAELEKLISMKIDPFITGIGLRLLFVTC